MDLADVIAIATLIFEKHLIRFLMLDFYLNLKLTALTVT